MDQIIEKLECLPGSRRVQVQRIGASLPHPVAHFVEKFCVAVFPGYVYGIDAVARELLPNLYKLVPGRRYADAGFVEEILAIEEDHAAKVRRQAIVVAVVVAQFELCGSNRGEVVRWDEVVQRRQPAGITEGCGHEIVEPE